MTDMIDLSLCESRRADLLRLARDRGLSLTEMVLVLLEEGLDRHAPPVAHLAADFRNAQSWPELQGRLALKGYALRPVRGALTLCHASGGGVICGLDALGVTESTLSRRLGGRFPGYVTRWMIDAALDARLGITPPADAAGGRVADGAAR